MVTLHSTMKRSHHVGLRSLRYRNAKSPGQLKYDVQQCSDELSNGEDFNSEGFGGIQVDKPNEAKDHCDDCSNTNATAKSVGKTL